MRNEFYLDDYNLIVTSNCKDFSRENIKILINNNEIKYDLLKDERNIKYILDYEYKDKDHIIVIHNNEIIDIQERFITHTLRFEEEYKCDLNTLGSIYTKEYTIFRIFAPFKDRAFLCIQGKKEEMNYLGKGIYETKINGDLDKVGYYYELIKNKETIKVLDPFSYSNSKDNKYSYVIDIDKISKEKIILKENSDQIIYEMSIKDFSYDKNIPFINRCKFISLIENIDINGQSYGTKYIKELGISHIQLMPVLNFDFDGSKYNWGYNPINYNTFQWDYVLGDDAYSPLEEFKLMVDYLHKNNIRVNLDVVYNHVYKIDKFDLNKILPFYFFRYDENGELEDGTYCGNELRTESYFLREYFNIINTRLIRMFDIDGLRYDLMGLIDINTINYLNSNARKLKSDFMFYGEGWNMGKALTDDNKACIENSEDMPNVLFFNGAYRDCLKGDMSNKYSLGFMFGDKGYEELVFKGINGNINKNLSYKNSINYAECHDNITIYDKTDLFEYSEIDRQNISKSILALVMLSKGTPFVHMGQEFFRSKNGIDNTYNMSIDINCIDWKKVAINKESINYFKELVKIRKLLNNNDYQKENFYEMSIFVNEKFDILINETQYDYNYAGWITYKDLLLMDGTYIHNKKEFVVPKFSLVIGIKE